MSSSYLNGKQLSFEELLNQDNLVSLNQINLTIPAIEMCKSANGIAQELKQGVFKYTRFNYDLISFAVHYSKFPHCLPRNGIYIQLRLITSVMVSLEIKYNTLSKTS